jgi:HAD superfamily hydrolase (TIGR01490 family)
MTGAGHRIGAFFDLDGTLVPSPSLERRMFHALRHNGEIPLTNYLRWGAEAFRLLPRGLSAITHANKRYLYGLRAEQLLQAIEPIAFFEEALARVEWHARQGHTIVLVSGTVKPIARLAAIALECELEARGLETEVLVSATRIEERDGMCTGRLIGEANYCETKRKAIDNVARAMQLQLRESHAYGNLLSDVSMLEAVGRAHAVNPAKELARIANNLNWMIWHWHHEKKPPSEEKIREKMKFQMIGT